MLEDTVLATNLARPRTAYAVGTSAHAGLQLLAHRLAFPEDFACAAERRQRRAGVAAGPVLFPDEVDPWEGGSFKSDDLLRSVWCACC